MARNYGVRDVQNWKFEDLPLSDQWKGHLGELTEGARILITGRPKNGKTEYLFQLMKHLATVYGKVRFNSAEQVRTKGLQKAYNRNKMQEVAGQFMLCDRRQKEFDVFYKACERPNSGKVLVIDSMDYMKMTVEQFEALHERFPKKVIIVVAWAENKAAKLCEYHMDVIVNVKQFIAYPISRMDGGDKYIIWPEKVKKSQSNQINLFNNVQR
jgi:nucleoside-triphosphatase THEP1